MNTADTKGGAADTGQGVIMEIALLLKIIFIICCVLALGEKLLNNKPFSDWIWPICALIWCII